MSAPEDPGDQLFDPAYMSALFEYGCQRVFNSAVWTAVDLNKLIVQQRN
jgi:hypothetical protein